jgi:hypothetical protein
MSLNPQIPLEEAVQPPGSTWVQKIGILLFVVFCFELGVFLLIFPWLDAWNNNGIASIAPWVRGIWVSPYFRGALSGLGVVNVYISLLEILRLRRRPAERMPRLIE